MVEVVVLEDVNAFFFQAREELEAEAILSGFVELGYALADGDQLLRGGHAVGAGFETSAFNLAF